MSQGKINVYVCPHGHRTVTIDADEGVTPFMILCRGNWPDGCNATAQSSMYRVDQELVPLWEWYKPEGAELKRLARSMREHVAMGGLVMRKLVGVRRDELAIKFGLDHLRVRGG